MTRTRCAPPRIVLLAAGFVLSAFLAGPASANWTATGQFKYRDRPQDLSGFTGATVDLPIRNAPVEIVRSPNTVLASGTTDAAGNFSIFVVDNVTATVFCRVISTGQNGYNLRVQSSTTTSTTYAVAGATVPNHNPATNTNFGVITALAGAGGEAFNILDILMDGTDYAATLLGARPGPTCTAVWSSGSTTGTFYGGGVIRLLADEGWDDSVILHEHGHFIDLTYSASDSPGGAHFLGDNNQDLRLAYGEGVATWHMATGRRVLGRGQPTFYIDSTGGTGAGNLNFSYELETPNISALGAASEVTVQAVLYDIEDGALDLDVTPGVDDDPLNLSHLEIWQVMQSYIPTALNKSLEDFFDGWFSPGINNGNLAGMEGTFGALSCEFFADAAEPDNSAAAARSVPVSGAPDHHSFYGTGDFDWVRFTSPAAGTKFILETVNLLGDGNTALTLYDTNGTTSLATNDNRGPGDDASLLIWTAPGAGTYYAAVNHAPDLGVYGSYDLRVIQGAPSGITLTDLASPAGTNSNRPARGAAWGDLDSDGDADLFVGCATGNSYHLYRNNGSGTFTDIAASAGVLGSGFSGQGASWGDYDNDGDLDLFVPVSGGGTNLLYRNNGNATFASVAAAAGVAYTGGGSLGAAWGDYDRDGLLDLYVATLAAPNLLYRNNGNGTFTDVAAAQGVAGGTVDSFRGIWCDYDRDLDLDLFVHQDGVSNRLYRNNGGSGFTDVTPPVMIETDVRSWGATWADLDHDGDFDLFVSNLGSPCRLYLNTGGGGFEEVGAAAGVNAAGSQTGNCVGDFDNDNDDDIYVTAFDEPNLFFDNLTGTAYFNSGKAADGLQGRSTAAADYDRDGDLDLFVGNSNGSHRLYTTGGATGAWIRLKLVGTVSNRSAIGARVTWRSGNQTFIRQVSGGGGYVSQDDLVLHFGLGATAGPDVFDIVWPSGAFQRVSGLARNATHTITEVFDQTGVTPPGDAAMSRPQLAQNVPNPFARGTRIQYLLPAPASASLQLFDPQGRLIRTLHDGWLPAGPGALHWDGRNDAGARVAPGVYFYRLVTPGSRLQRKLVLATE